MAWGCCTAAPGRCGNRLSLIPCLTLGVQFILTPLVFRFSSDAGASLVLANVSSLGKGCLMQKINR